MPGWGELFMELRVDKRKVKDDVEAGLKEAKGDAAGKRVGDEFGKGFGTGSAPRLRDVHGRFIKDFAAAGKTAGDESGRSYGQAFTQLTSGIARSFWQGYRANSRQHATAAGGDDGRSFGQSFTALTSGIAGSFWQGFRANSGRESARAGDEAGQGFAGSFRKAIAGLGRDAERDISLGARTAAGFSPGLLGIRPTTKAGLIGGAITAGLAAGPAAIAGVGALGVAGAGAGVLGAGFGAVQSQVSPLLQQRAQAQAAAQKATTPAQQQAAAQQMAQVNQQIAQLSPALQSIVKSETQIQDTWKKFAASLAPLFAGPVAQVARLFGQLTGPLHQMFAGAATLAKPLIDGIGQLAKDVLPLLGQAFRAVAPLVTPLLRGLDQLLKGLLPGLITLLKAAQPAVSALSSVLGTLGKGVGDMLGALAPAIKASAVVFKALGDAVSALFPVLGQLASVFATGLAPVFAQLAAAVKALAPFLVLVGKAVAALAGVMFGVLNAALTAVVKLLQAIAPALTAFAGMLTQIFTVLANKNVFQMLATAIEGVVPVLATLINAVIGGLMPILPPVIDFMTKLAGMIAGALGNALRLVIPLLVRLATTVLGTIAKILPVILPVLLKLVDAIGSQLGRALAIVLPVLAKVGGVLLTAIAKVLPSLVPLFVLLAGTVSGPLLGALLALVPPLAQLALILAQELAAVLPIIVPIAARFLGLFTEAVVGVITGIAKALAAVLSAIPPPVLAGIVTAIALIVGGLKLWAIAQGILNLVMLAGPWGWIALAIGGIVIAIVLLVKHWNTVWSTIKTVAKDVWEFLTHGWGQFLFPALYLIRKVVELVRDHWRDAWNLMQDVARNFYTWLWTDFGAKIGAFFTKTIPGWFTFVVNGAKLFWHNMQDAFAAGWKAVWDHTLAPLIRFFAQTIPRIWADEVAGWKLWWRNIEGAFAAGWTAVWNHTLAPLIRFFTQTLPRIWGQAWADAKRLWTNYGNAFRDGWNSIVTHVLNPVRQFMTVTVPGWWDTAVRAIKGFWDKLGGIVKVPVNFLIGTVYDNGIRAFWNAIVSKIPGIPNLPMIKTLAAGGRLPGFGGGDRHLALLESGEAVVDKFTTRAHAGTLRAWGVPGMQAGGKVGQHAPGDILPGAGSRFGPIPGVDPHVVGDIGHFFGKAFDLGKIAAGVLTGNTTAAANALNDFIGVPGGTAGPLAQMMLGIPKRIVKGLVGLLTGASSGSGSDIVKFALSFLGKIPYTWGGVSLTASDCSGFVQAIYHHFGINAPRTSEAQGQWVKRGPPVPGGLAFYHSPPGGPDPGHVAIVKDALTVISQGGGMGPKLMGLHGMPLLWTGTPPGGLGRGGATPGSMSAQAIAALWTQLGGPSFAAANMARIALAESGDVPSIIQKGMPPGLTGWGLYQITPTSGINQNGAFGDLLNAANNTRAAISLFRSSGYGPWTSDPVGAGLVRSGLTYANGGWINEPVLGMGRYSRALYSFGEAGREYVTPEQQMGAAGPGGGAPLIGSYHTNYYGTGDVAEAMRELAFTLRRVKQGAFFPAGA